MKSLTMNLMLATAAWMVASSAAVAADMKFEIPFAFQVKGHTLAPGTYKLHAGTGEVHFSLQEEATGKGIYFNAPAGYDPQKGWRDREGGILQFACGNGECALREIFTNTGFPAYKFPTPKTQDGKSMRLALIRAANAK